MYGKGYKFNEYYGSELRTALEGRSFGLRFNKIFTGPVNLIEVEIRKNFLPKHCNLELVKGSLSGLEENPADILLLKALEKYTRNNLFERTGYWAIKLLKYGIFLSAISVFFIPAKAIILISTSLVLAYLSLMLDPFAGFKFGRHISEFFKGKNHEQVYLKKTEESLIELINENNAFIESATNNASALRTLPCEDQSMTAQVNPDRYHSSLDEIATNDKSSVMTLPHEARRMIVPVMPNAHPSQLFFYERDRRKLNLVGTQNIVSNRYESADGYYRCDVSVMKMSCTFM